MRYIVSLVLLLAWALWLGGSIALVVFLIELFHNHRDLAIPTATAIINTFECYQVTFAVIAVAAALAWYLLDHSVLRIALLTLLVLAAVAALVSATVLTPQLTEMVRESLVDTDRFRTLHGLSRSVSSLIILLLLAVGCLLPPALRKRT